MNINIYELKYLKKNFHMESQTLLRDSPALVEDKKTNQRSIQTQNQQIPEHEGLGKGRPTTEEYVTSRKGRGRAIRRETNNATPSS
jgi:hypothetical protein